jgi:hypothetical protein
MGVLLSRESMSDTGYRMQDAGQEHLNVREDVYASIRILLEEVPT